MELITGLEPVTSYLPSKCSTTELYEPVLKHPNLRWRIISLKIDKLNLFYGKYLYEWWRRLDSNQRTRREQIYSLPPLTARPLLHIKVAIFVLEWIEVNYIMNNLSQLIQNDVLRDLNQDDLDCYFFETIDSTNSFAKQTKLQKPFLIVLSEQQTAGRGRHGKTWHSPESGNIYLSIKYQAQELEPSLSLVTGLLIAEALDETAGQKITAGLKWPNDILLNNKKICGILIESEITDQKIECTIGIGINYSIPKKESWWGDLGALKKILPRERLINAILKKIISYQQNRYPNWQEAWHKRCMHQNAEISILTRHQKEVKGIFRGVDNQGKMLLETNNEIQSISAGECSIKGLY